MGTSFTAFSPTQTTSPVLISGLTNGTTYNVQLVAVNAAGDSSFSTTATGTPFILFLQLQLLLLLLKGMNN